jgi:hypothetical protein
MVMPMPSVVQLKRHPPKAAIRAAIARLSPPADHNISGLPVLTPEETAICERGRQALANVRQTFEHWMALARSLKVLADKAGRVVGGHSGFRRLREREGFGGLHRGTVSNLLKISARLREVEAWRAGLSERERFRWAGPEAILRHCPLFAPVRPVANPGGGKWPRIEVTASADAIATTLLTMFLPAKAEAIARAVLAKLKQRPARQRLGADAGAAP